MALPILVATPDPFSFVSSEWEEWKTRFERYRDISGLSDKSEKVQVSTLIYTMGPQAESVFTTLNIPVADKDKYQEVADAFTAFFIPRTNIIFERAKFNKRVQEQGEPVDTFIADLHSMANKCKYGTLKEELIRDRIVVGIADSKLSEKLQMDEALTLVTAIQKVQQAEIVHAQQVIVRPNGDQIDKTQVAAIKKQSSSGSKSNTAKSNAGRQSKSSHGDKNKKPCGYCGYMVHSGESCPASNVFCKNCKKKGHYARVCRSRDGNPSVRAVEKPRFHDSNPIDSFFIGSVSTADTNAEPWTLKVTVGKNKPGSVHFTLDSGADITCMSSDSYNPKWGELQSVSCSITGPSGSKLEVLGRVFTTFSYKQNKCNGYIYLIKNLSRPLLGRPELRSLKVFSVSGVQCDEKPADRKYWLKQFPKLFSGLGRLEHSYKISLKGGIEPFSCSVARRVSLPQLPKVEKALNSMVDQGIISSVTQPTDWCAPMVVVPKPSSGDVRITTDFTELNRAVRREKFEMPSVDFALGRLGGAKFFSKLDANSGFFQIVLDKQSQILTTFITPFGRYCYHRLPMGISSAPEVFSRAVQQILQGLDGVSNLVDDICVYAATKQEHDRRLKAVLSKLHDAGVTLNPDKCVFGASSLKYLGFLITKNGVSPDPDKVSAITKFPVPKDVSDIRRFLGMVNNLARFVPNLSSVLEPIRLLLRKDSVFSWDVPQQMAFDQVKSILVSPDVLVLYHPQSETCLRADSSSYGLGAVLLQRQENNVWKPVSYISRSLTSAEKGYATIEKEALAITWSCERFSQYLLGKHFLIQTDHNPLVSLLAKRRLDELPIRIQRFRLRLLRFSYDIEYIAGSKQIVADTLSRAPLPGPVQVCEVALSEAVEEYAVGALASFPASREKLQEIAEKQDQDSVLHVVKKYCQSVWPPKVEENLLQYSAVQNELSVIDGVLVKGNRLVIPPCLYAEMLDRLHEGHQGVNKCVRRARDSVWWPNITVHIKHLLARCNICMQFRENAAEPMISIPRPERPWQFVGTDLFELHGKLYLLVVDFFSRYIETAILSSSSAFAVIPHLKSIFARHGVPDLVISDGGPPYNSKSFTEFSVEYNFTHQKSSPKYPQGNGAAERAVGTVKSLLKKALAAKQDPYLAMLAYRTTPLENGFSPSQLLMGCGLRTPLPVLPSVLAPQWPEMDLVQEREAVHRERMKRNYDKRKGVHELQPLHPGQKVHLKGRGKAEVRKNVGNRSYVFQHTDGAVVRRNRRFAIAIPPKPVLTQAHSTHSTHNVFPKNEPSQVPCPTTVVEELPRRSQRSTKGQLPLRYRDLLSQYHPLSKKLQRGV